jgi:hypothetical protein
VNLEQATSDHLAATRPTWEMVEDLLAELSSTKSPFNWQEERTYRLEGYQPDWRVRAVAGESSRWVEVEDIRTCWATFERLGRIESKDVLEPGRCSSLMMALFEQIPGIEQPADGSASLAFA